MRISLIITTYNWKEALERSLHSVLAQTLLPLEVLVADDGSGPDTGDLVRAVAQTAPIPVIHSWQEDRGFRSARSRNLAIARAQGDYLILIDGDILLEPHFIADHRPFARPRYFVQGTRALLGPERSAQVLAGGPLGFGLFTPGVENRKNCLRSVWLARLFSLPSRRLAGIKTCNFAFWRQDAWRVNGFNEDFVGWGREDSEFAARLINSGLRRRDLKFHGLGYHLHHPIQTRDRLAINDALLQATITEKRSRCERGLDLHLAPQGL